MKNKFATDVIEGFLKNNLDGADIAQSFSNNDEKFSFDNFNYYLKQLLGINWDAGLNENFEELKQELKDLIYAAYDSADLKKIYKNFVKKWKKVKWKGVDLMKILYIFGVKTKKLSEHNIFQLEKKL